VLRLLQLLNLFISI